MYITSCIHRTIGISVSCVQWGGGNGCGWNGSWGGRIASGRVVHPDRVAPASIVRCGIVNHGSLDGGVKVVEGATGSSSEMLGDMVQDRHRAEAFSCYIYIWGMRFPESFPQKLV